MPTSGTGNSGNVNAYYYKDNLQCFSHTATFTYDNVNRLSTAGAVPANGCTYNYSQSYIYTKDGSTGQYGNMTCATGCTDTCATGCTNPPAYMPANLAFSASSNHITSTGYAYDAAGNLTTDGSNSSSHTYQWDAEGRVASVDSGTTWSFTYDAVGDRVAWVSGGTTYNYLFDPAGNRWGWREATASPCWAHGPSRFTPPPTLGSTTSTTSARAP